MKNEDKDIIKEWRRCCEIGEEKIGGDGKYRGRGVERERENEKCREKERQLQ